MIFKLIIGIIIFIILGMSFNFDKKVFTLRLRTRQWFVLIYVAYIIGTGFIQIVPANSVGVKYNPFNGGTQTTVLSEGFKFKSIFEVIYVLPTTITELTFEDISIQTKDSQFVKTTIQVQARIDADNAYEYFKKYGSKKLIENQNILSNTIQKELESISTQYNVMDILGESRNEIVNLSLANIQTELAKDGILVERIVLVDTDAGEAVEAAIANEAIAKKEVEIAQYAKEKAEIEGEAKVIEAQKQQEANDILSETLTDQILTQQFIEKWNGQLPNVVSDGNILDITGFIN